MIVPLMRLSVHFDNHLDPSVWEMLWSLCESRARITVLTASKNWYSGIILELGSNHLLLSSPPLANVDIVLDAIVHVQVWDRSAEPTRQPRGKLVPPEAYDINTRRSAR